MRDLLRILNFAVRPEEVWTRCSAWAFFLHTFFITFINFRSAVEISRSIQNFSTIIFFCKRNSVFSDFEKTVSKFLQISVTPNSNFLAKFLINRDTHIHWCSTVFDLLSTFRIVFLQAVFFCSGILNIDGNSRLTQPWKNIFPKLPETMLII